MENIGMPTLDDLLDYLESMGQTWHQDQVRPVLDAEYAAQRAVCGRSIYAPATDDLFEFDPMPFDMVQALYRRVARSLALRALPLGFQADPSESTVAITRVGGTDPEIRRLEAPYRKRVLG